MLDPRTKLLLALLYTALAVMTRKPEWRLAEAVVLWGVVLVLRQGKAYLRWLRMLIPMALFFGGITWWSAGLASGYAAALGLITITTVFFVFFASTQPEDLGNSLVQTGLPFPVAFVLTAAMQLAPVVGRKARSVIEAQQARGIALKPGWQALRNYPALLIPVLVQSFQMADSLAEAMEARGFGRPGRSFRKVYRLRIMDGLVLLAGAAAVVGLVNFVVR
jgi:energy-coupling factor transport system permease protein